jgi:CheY-like chemotaxis protein
MLEKAGLIVTIANNGEEAIEKVEDSEFDLVLMDVQMPEMDGLEATGCIRKNSRFSNLPIIAMTAQAMTGDREKCIEVGMDDYITKPIDINELFCVLVKWIKPKERESNDTDTSQKDFQTDEKPSEDAQLPTLPGIDINSGLIRVGGNMKLYKKLLIKFRNDYSKSLSEIKTALENGNFNEAERFVHSIKGVTGNIGINKLYKITADFEAIIRKRETGKYKAMLNQYSRELNNTLTSLQVLKDEDDKYKKGKEGATQAKPSENFAELLESLLANIKTRKPKKCAPIIEEISKIVWPVHLDTKITELIKLIGRYKFKEAEMILRSIINKLLKGADE